MARPDGRIEPGQPIRRAISARAWNRAQDAADIVLGKRTGFAAEAGAPYKTYQDVVATNFAGTNIRQYEAVFLEYGQANAEDRMFDLTCRFRRFPAGGGQVGRRRDRKFGVAVEPIRSGRPGRIAVSGVVQCLCAPPASNRRGGYAVASGLLTNPSAVVPNPSGFAKILGFTPYFDPEESGEQPSETFRLAILDLNQSQLIKVSLYEPAWDRLVDNFSSSFALRTTIPERSLTDLSLELEDANFSAFNAIAELPQGNKVLTFAPAFVDSAPGLFQGLSGVTATAENANVYMLVAAQCESTGDIPTF